MEQEGQCNQTITTTICTEWFVFSNPKACTWKRKAQRMPGKIRTVMVRERGEEVGAEYIEIEAERKGRIRWPKPLSSETRKPSTTVTLGHALKNCVALFLQGVACRGAKSTARRGLPSAACRAAGSLRRARAENRRAGARGRCPAPLCPATWWKPPWQQQEQQRPAAAFAWRTAPAGQGAEDALGKWGRRAQSAMRASQTQRRQAVGEKNT